MTNTNGSAALRQSVVVLVAVAASWLGAGQRVGIGLAHADSCVPSRMMMVLDRSSSMKELIPGTQQTKWQAAQMAVGALATKFESTIDMGLMIFPDPSACSPGKVVISPAPKQGAAINGKLAGGPVSNAWTPMAQSIDAASADASLADPKRRPSLLLVTDGWQWCSPYDASTRFHPVDAVMRAKAKGITVYVVGFGRGVDVLALNRMAAAAGTAFPGCDPTGADWMAPKKCYFQAEDQAQLQMALAMVAVQVSAEVCDGVDNNCDGQIDEHLTRACQTACGAGTEGCFMGRWGGCDAPQPAPESCDGNDNDCNGSTDEGCDCIEGETRACGTHSGACRRGVQRCVQGGTWSMTCEGEIGPTTEVCNGVDDDCDDLVDEDDQALCPNGQVCRGGGCEPALPAAPDGNPDGGGPPSEENGGDPNDPNDPNGPNGPGGGQPGNPHDPNDPNGLGGKTVDGCGCRVAAGRSDESGAGWVALGGLMMAVVVRRRRRS